MTQLNLDDRDVMDNAASSDPPNEKEVGEVLKDLATRVHKSPGLDGVHAGMVVTVWGAGCERGPSDPVPEHVVIRAIAQSMA